MPAIFALVCERSGPVGAVRELMPRHDLDLTLVRVEPISSLGADVFDHPIRCSAIWRLMGMARWLFNAGTFCRRVERVVIFTNQRSSAFTKSRDDQEFSFRLDCYT